MSNLSALSSAAKVGDEEPLEDVDEKLDNSGFPPPTAITIFACSMRPNSQSAGRKLCPRMGKVNVILMFGNIFCLKENNMDKTFIFLSCPKQE